MIRFNSLNMNVLLSITVDRFPFAFVKVISLFLPFFLVGICSAQSQAPFTVRAMTAGGSTQNGVYAALGQPFYTQTSNGSYEVACGVAQAQLVTLDIEDETCENEPYTEHTFNFPAFSLEPGSIYKENYSHNVDTLNGYDLLNRLTFQV